jgi:hypothetical protein
MMPNYVNDKKRLIVELLTLQINPLYSTEVACNTSLQQIPNFSLAFAG